MRNAELYKLQFAQRGMVLVLSLLILLVLTILGVAAMNSTMMQERMAGNTRTQTLAFEEASGGVSRALDFFYCAFADPGDGNCPQDGTPNVPANDYDLLCGLTHGNPADPNDGEVWSYPENGEFNEVSTNGRVRMEQRMYCCQNWAQIEDEDGSPLCVENPSKLFVLNRGSFLADDGVERLATREVEVRLAEADPADPTCAICLPGPLGDFRPPNSGALRVHGMCGPAVTTRRPEDAIEIRDGLPDNVVDNFNGGITHGDMGSPWNDANSLAEFVFWAKLGLDPANYLGNNPSSSATYGTVENPQITYVDGDVNFSGNTSGAGIMIVRGELNWRGTPNFKGLLLSLGGGFSVGGGGQGGNPEGSFVATNLTNADGTAPNLMNRHVLHYAVSKASDPSDDYDEMVLMYDPEDFSGTEVRRAIPGGGQAGSSTPVRHVPARPVLRTEEGARLIHYFDPDLSAHRFFHYETFNGNPRGSEVTLDIESDGAGGFSFNDGGIPQFTLPLQIDPARDRYGRLIPDFVTNQNWPPYEFSPNEWGWGLCKDDDDGPFCDDPPFALSSTDIEWRGGGNQAFTYDCRRLLRLRHELLCADQAEDLPDDPNDDYFQNPDPEFCSHPFTDTEYNEDIEDLDSLIPNQHAWHLWTPRCDCMGINAETDMVLSGWRENLGWRDDDEFIGCASMARAQRCE